MNDLYDDDMLVEDYEDDPEIDEGEFDDIDTDDVYEAIESAESMIEDADDDEDDLDEFFPFPGGVLAARTVQRALGKKVRSAKPRRPYSAGIRGRQYAQVKTPAGSARIVLPGRFPTLKDHRRSLARVQRDIRKNSTGIRDLVKRQKKLAELAGRSDRGLDKKVKTLQWAVVILALSSLPQTKEILNQITNK